MICSVVNRFRAIPSSPHSRLEIAGIRSLSLASVQGSRPDADCDGVKVALDVTGMPRAGALAEPVILFEGARSSQKQMHFRRVFAASRSLAGSGTAKDGQTVDNCSLCSGDDRRHSRFGHCILQRSFLGTANGEYRHSFGLRSFLLEILGRLVRVAVSRQAALHPRTPIASSYLRKRF